LLKQFGSVDSALDASVCELTKVDGVGTRTAEQIVRTREDFNVEGELALADKLGVCIMNLEDERYPAPLSGIYDAPPILYVKGTLVRQDALAIAIVGSRRCSIYGQEQAGRFAHLLASSGFTIVSGMARGIDTAAHRGALTAKARTIAVQGCGLSHVFPPENKQLFEEIAASGACISELPLAYEPRSENFPPRNRIIAGLSLGVIVVEAMERSGALISAKAALEYDREVMAIPGKIDSPLSAGSHRLIKDGAKLVDRVEDVMEALGYIGDQIKSHVSTAASEAQGKMETPLFDIARLALSPDETTVHNCLSKEPIHIEELIGATHLAVGTISASLISLRLKGLIKQLPGNLFIRN
ncbi:MAG: DNA-processing protein DprA, partial [Sedimentisphaerales bacterium]|nr:DNA-processing protein DprA [Sedimentisphaerales bacterium]